MKPTAFIALLALLLVSSRGVCFSGTDADVSRPGQTAAPDFGPNVLIFDPSMTNIQSRIDAIFSKQECNQFGSYR
jgi:hypothetical protein